MQNTPESNNNGLLHGKLGVSIFFFRLAQTTGNDEHQEFAETLLDQIYQAVNRQQITPDFENGLAGIAWGMRHLIQKDFVEADADAILSDVDNRIFRYLAGSPELPAGVMQGIMGYMIYLISLMDGKNVQTDNDDTYIFQRLLIDLVNRLGAAVDEKKLTIDEPRLFTLNWELPVCLILLGKCCELQVHQEKVTRILQQLDPVVRSLYPRLSAHRFYMVSAMERVMKYLRLPGWRSHADMINSGIHPEDITGRELKNKQIRMMNGIAGLSMVNHILQDASKEKNILLSSQMITEKIITSEYWASIEENSFEKQNIGWYTGFAGIGLALLDYTNEPLETVSAETDRSS